MKKTTTMIGSLLFAAASWAQVPSGKIMFEETVRMELQTEGEAAQFANMLPREQRFEKVLHFNETSAIYLPLPKKKTEEAEAANGNVRMRIRMDVPEDKIYTDLKAGRTIEQREFMTRKFLVSGDAEKASWKLTGRQKKVLEYPCQEAVRMNEKDTITVWFTTAIPVSAGPQGWTGLPGMILEGDRNGRVHIQAVSVEPGMVDEKLLIPPKEGKKVTRQEFKEIVAARMKEMQEQNGGNGNVIIRIQN